MQMLRLLYATLLILAFSAPAALADAKAVRERYVSILQEDGYGEIRITRTLLGRMRFVATRPDARREIVVNPASGVVLRDYIRVLGNGGGSSSGSGAYEDEDDDEDDDRDDDNESDDDDDEGSDDDDEGSDDDDDESDNSGSGSSDDDDDDESDNSGSGSSDDDDD